VVLLLITQTVSAAHPTSYAIGTEDSFPWGKAAVCEATHLHLVLRLSAAIPLLSAAIPLLSAAIPILSAAIPLLSAAIPLLSAAIPLLSAARPLLPHILGWHAGGQFNNNNNNNNNNLHVLTFIFGGE
jgi:hypothetical protein